MTSTNVNSHYVNVIRGFFSTLQLQRQISSVPVLHRVYSCMKSSVLQLVNITEQAVKQTEPVCQDVVRLRHDIMHRIKKKKAPTSVRLGSYQAEIM